MVKFAIIFEHSRMSPYFVYVFIIVCFFFNLLNFCFCFFCAQIFILVIGDVLSFFKAKFSWAYILRRGYSDALLTSVRIYSIIQNHVI